MKGVDEKLCAGSKAGRTAGGLSDYRIIDADSGAVGSFFCI